MFDLRCYNRGFALNSMLSGSAVLAVCVDEEFDVIVLDPLKLTTLISSLDKASWKYHAFNHDAMNLIN